MRRTLTPIALALLLAAPARAVLPDEMLADPALDRRANAVRSMMSICSSPGKNFSTVASAIHGLALSRSRTAAASRNSSDDRPLTPPVARISSWVSCLRPLIATRRSTSVAWPSSSNAITTTAAP